MAPTQISISEDEIAKANPLRLIEMYSRLDIRLARLIEDTVSIYLPGGYTAQEVRSRFLFCATVADWRLLPWVAYLGDSQYINLLRHAVEDFRIVETAGVIRLIPEKKAWELVVLEQIENLDELANKKRIPKRQWKTRRNNLHQYLLGDG